MEDGLEDKKIERREFLKKSAKLLVKTSAFSAAALFTNGCGFGYRISDHTASLLDKKSLENSIRSSGQRGGTPKTDVPCGESLRNMCDKHCKHSKTNF